MCVFCNQLYSDSKATLHWAGRRLIDSRRWDSLFLSQSLAPDQPPEGPTRPSPGSLPRDCLGVRMDSHIIGATRWPETTPQVGSPRSLVLWPLGSVSSLPIPLLLHTQPNLPDVFTKYRRNHRLPAVWICYYPAKLPQDKGMLKAWQLAWNVGKPRESKPKAGGPGSSLGGLWCLY